MVFCVLLQVRYVIRPGNYYDEVRPYLTIDPGYMMLQGRTDELPPGFP